MKIILLATAALLSACTSVSPPSLTVANVAKTQRSDEGLGLEFTLDAVNPNEVGLPLRTAQYTVELAGRTVFTGTRSPEATLRRLGTQQIVLPAVVRLADHPELASAGRVPYRINGQMLYIAPGQIAEILFDSGVRVPSSAFSATGEVDLGP